MNQSAPHSEEAKRLLRAYVLETLKPGERAQVAGWLAESAAWAEALEAVRAELALLDALPEVEPGQDLTAAVMGQLQRVDDERLVKQARLRRWRVVEFVGAAAMVLLVAAILLPSLARSRESARRSSCENNLKQIGLVLAMYADESEGHRYPPMTRYDNLWMFDIETVYPEYLTDPAILLCPSGSIDADEFRRLFEEEPVDWRRITHIAAQNYAYTAWAVQNEVDFLYLQEERLKLAKAEPVGDVRTPGGGIFRLREGVERFLVPDINNPAAAAKKQSAIPVMMDNIRGHAHVPGGAHVLYMDGHIEFIRLNKAFPVTEAIANALNLPAPHP